MSQDTRHNLHKSNVLLYLSKINYEILLLKLMLHCSLHLFCVYTTDTKMCPSVVTKIQTGI